MNERYPAIPFQLKVFFELGIKLLKAKGFLGYITPNTYFDLLKSGKKLREYLFSNTLLKIVELYNVFPDAIVEPVISIYQKIEDLSKRIEIILIPRNTTLLSTFENYGIHIFKDQNELHKNKDLTFIYKSTNETESLISIIKEKTKPLKTYCYVYNGSKPYCKNKGIPPQTKEMIDKKIYNDFKKHDETWIKYYRGKYISRFTDKWNGEYIKYGLNLAEPRKPEVFFREKIFIRQTGDTVIATIDNGNFTNNTMHIAFPKDNSISNAYLLGLLNSELMTWYYQTTHPTEVGKPMAEVKKAFVENLPIIIPEKSIVEKVEIIVDELLCKCQNRYDKGLKFSNYIQKTYEPKKITEAMLEFQGMSFKDYLLELKKQKVKLSAKEQMELLDLFEEYKNNINFLSDEIQRKYAELNDIVFSIYGISNSDIDAIKQSVKINI
ncbi:MAG: hypothetical protein IKP78_07815 [Ruminococcus sp.]|nr:hypothetical protein [Ruminococcus sp.]